MKKSSFEVQSAFENDLQSLLDKYGADLEVRPEGVEIVMWSNSEREYTEFVLPMLIEGVK